VPWEFFRLNLEGLPSLCEFRDGGALAGALIVLTGADDFSEDCGDDNGDNCGEAEAGADGGFDIVAAGRKIGEGEPREAKFDDDGPPVGDCCRVNSVWPLLFEEAELVLIESKIDSTKVRIA